MSFQLQIDAGRRFVELRYEGVVDVPTLLEAITSINEQVSFEHIMYGISDFRGATMKVEKSDLPKFIAAKDPELFGRARWALLIDSPRETALGMVYTRMKEQVHRHEVFSTREAALEWLQIPDAKPERTGR
jgi:hypothetical protein